MLTNGTNANPPRGKCEWIKVSDRLPKQIAEAHLVHEEYLGVHVSFYDGARKWTHPFYNTFRNVTHWMPLPEPPEMDEEVKS